LEKLDDDDDDDDVDDSRAWVSIRENMKKSVTDSLGYNDLIQHKQWLDEKCSKLLHRLHNSRQTNADNLNSRTFWNKKREHLKDKITELETKSKNKCFRDFYRGISEFKKGHHARNDLVKDEDCDMLTDFHNILNRWNNYVCYLLNVRSVNDVKWTEMHIAEPLAPKPTCFDVKMKFWQNLSKQKMEGFDYCT
jgi:hypothetical protein